ncbi:hypothetical protein Dimus_033347 [Dionaea muscipula]
MLRIPFKQSRLINSHVIPIDQNIEPTGALSSTGPPIEPSGSWFEMEPSVPCLEFGNADGSTSVFLLADSFLSSFLVGDLSDLTWLSYHRSCGINIGTGNQNYR